MANRIRIVIEDSRAAPTLSYVRVYSAPPEVEISHEGKDFIGETEVYLVADRSSATIYYTRDGSQPGEHSTRHSGGPLYINESTTLRAVAFDNDRKGIYSKELTLTRHDASSLMSPARRLDDPPLNTGGVMATARDTTGELRPVESKERFISIPMKNSEVDVVYEGFVRCQHDGMYVFHLPEDAYVECTIGDKTIQNALGESKEFALPMQKGWHPISVTWHDAHINSNCNIEWKSPKRSLRLLRGKDLGCNVN